MSEVSSLANASLQSLSLPLLPPSFNYQELNLLLRRQRKVLTCFSSKERTIKMFSIRRLLAWRTRRQFCFCSLSWSATAWHGLISSPCWKPTPSRHAPPSCRSTWFLKTQPIPFYRVAFDWFRPKKRSFYLLCFHFFGWDFAIFNTSILRAGPVKKSPKLAWFWKAQTGVGIIASLDYD